MWSTVAHHERDIERVAARRVLQEEGEEAHTRRQRKVESSGAEKVEGRFFLQDKLCALGLAEVKTDAGYINQFTDGPAKLFKSANRKSANSLAYPLLQIRIFFYYYPQFANPRISTKYCTTLSQDSS